MLPLCSSVDITTTNPVDGFKYIANNRTFIVFLRRVERLFNLLPHNVHVYCTTGIVHCISCLTQIVYYKM